ncbi:MAG TPA: hypothetical protein VJA16_20380 [Thermoanaerobaculia bacterium]
MGFELQVAVLADHGAAPAEVEELLRYNENPFSVCAAGPVPLPLPDEPFVSAWEVYTAEARRIGAGAVLLRVLPQLCFPIRAGISASPDYRAATRRGEAPDGLAAAGGLPLERPELLEIVLHPSAAGRIPLLVSRHRQDFVRLVQALTGRNEPVPVPPTQGAAMVSGYVNWQRVGELRRAWEAAAPAVRGGGTWDGELARLAERRELYQDRFILLSDGPYSGVPAAALGLEEEEWRRRSLVIRREHECAHYLTRRLFGAMRYNALDELLADFAGITAAAGGFRADWFLRFVGLEAFPRYRAGARLDLYRGKPPLSAGAFAVLHALLHAAAHGLERWDAGLPRPAGPLAVAIRLAAVATLRLEDLASAAAGARLHAAHARASALLGGSPA